MTPAAPGIISLSASQAEEFDPEQVGGCPRRWFMHRVERLPVPESDNARADGDAGHALFAMHYRGEALPKRARMLKAVRGALATGRLPAREPGQLVESRFDGQPARDANGERVPLRHSSTLWLGGVPWDGYVDLRFYHAGMITVLDHKFSSDIHTYAKTDLLSTVQMPVYALDSLRIWPEAQHVELVHNDVSRRGVDSLYVRQLVTVTQIRNRAREIEGLVQRMQGAALAKSADDVPANKKSCHTWSGCPFQSRCSAYMEKPKMNLDSDEAEWLQVLGGGEAAKTNGPVGEPAPLPEFLKEKLVTPGPEAAHAAELEIASAAGALDPDEDPFAVFAPVASVPQEQPAPPVEPKPTVHGVVARISSPEKCPDCPHPAHVGAACTGKRGSRNCRCKGVAVLAVEQARCEPGCEKDHVVHAAAKSIMGAPLDAEAARERAAALGHGHLPTCVQNDAGKWLCMEGCTAGTVTLNPDAASEADQPLSVGPIGADPAAVYQAAQASPEGLRDALARERDMHRRTLGELDASERALKAARTELERLRPLEKTGPATEPIPMLLWCPACHARHIDEGEFAEKSHHTHACQSCGLAWRPAVVATVGVQFLPGFRN